MKDRTNIEIKSSKRQIEYNDRIFMMGSCFTDNIGELFNKYLFHADINPFGVIYNPLSIHYGISQLLHRERYIPEDLFQYNELYFSFDHYTLFSDPDQDKALEKINSRFFDSKLHFTQSNFIILTFGTAFIYKLKETGRIVNNCHKLPSNLFKRYMLGIDEIVTTYRDMILELQSRIPDLHIIFTVSPVRHIKDGLAENQLSKSTLLLAIRELVNEFPFAASYFPSYEIMIDDLRDYRYYTDDLVHPNSMAKAYIWEKFSESCISAGSLEIMTRLESLLKNLYHRPVHPGTKAYQKFLEKTKIQLEELKLSFPQLNWKLLEEKPV